MLIRIFLIIAILGGLAVGIINFVVIKDKINTTQTQRDTFKKNAADEAAAKNKAQKLAKDTQTKLDATNAMLVATMNERDQAVARADEKQKQADALSETLKKSNEDRDNALNKVAAWEALGIPIERMKSTLASLKTVTEDRDTIAAENKILNENLDRAKKKIAYLLDSETVVEEPAGLRGKVLVADPRYDFVVLDIGKNQHVVEDGKFIVNRNGRLIAKVQIKTVQQDRCVANIVPGWKLGDIMEGDQVLY